MGKHSRMRPPVRRLVMAIDLTAGVAAVVVVALIAIAWFSIPGSAKAKDPARTAAALGAPVESIASQSPSAESSAPAPAQSHVPAKKGLGEHADNPAAFTRKVQRRADTARSQAGKSDFRIASLNILGSNHVGNGMNRARGEAALLQARGVDIAGLQEVQRDQRQAFLAAMPAYTMWPQDAVGRDGYRKQILFRTSRFEMVDNGSVNAPFTGMSVPIPYVLLRDRSSGAEFWVVDSHNSPQGRQAERNVATSIQVNLVDRLNDTHPVLVVGDMNEHQTWFCRFASQVSAWSANGGYYNDGCHVPGGPIRIDWIVGSATVSHVAEAPVGSALPAASVARTVSVCEPRPRPSIVSGLVQAAKAPPSSEHRNVAAASSALNSTVAAEPIVSVVGAAVIAVFGAVVSTVNVCAAALASVLPAASVARTANECEPSASLASVYGLVQEAQVPVDSTRHWKVEPDSLDVNANVGVASLVVPVGPDVIDVAGAVVSGTLTVNVRVAGEASVLPAASVALTPKVWLPAPSEL